MAGCAPLRGYPDTPENHLTWPLHRHVSDHLPCSKQSRFFRRVLSILPPRPLSATAHLQPLAQPTALRHPGSRCDIDSHPDCRPFLTLIVAPHMGIYRGGAIKNAPRPALIYHVPGQGACIAVAEDDDLVEWRELPQNPVIQQHGEGDEFFVFDPAGWYEEGNYHALIDSPLGVPATVLPLAPWVDARSRGRGLPRLLPDRQGVAHAPHAGGATPHPTDALPPLLPQHHPLLPRQLPGPPCRRKGWRTITKPFVF